MALNDLAALISDVGSSLGNGLVSIFYPIRSQFRQSYQLASFHFFFHNWSYKNELYFGSLFFIWFCLWVSLLCFFYQKVNIIN